MRRVFIGANMKPIRLVGHMDKRQQRHWDKSQATLTLATA